MIRTYYTLCFLLCCTYCTEAQSLGPSTLNTMGKSTIINNNITIEQSMGGIVAGNTFISSVLIVTPGELQPQLSITPPPNGIGNISGTTFLVTVFPNPTNQTVSIQGNFASQQSLNCTLSDALGRILMQKVFLLEKGNERQEIDLSAFASGQYILNLKWTQSNADFNRAFKIQKIK